eukprot:snap_masked-scaffold403_size186359-processed-gene-0.10 protein:Tk07441 transcript:snap_masked-scaffold403_size186359-processed-gene-0.10-mRNA-1 annotation:"Spz3"
MITTANLASRLVHHVVLVSTLFGAIAQGTTVKPAGYDYNPPQPYQSVNHAHAGSPPLMPSYTPAPYYGRSPQPYGVTPAPYPAYGYTPVPDYGPHIHDETYLCPSSTGYVMPLRAMNTDGKWRIVVNEVKAHYETLSQTARLEECTTPGQSCPLIPECYETQCLQKFIYHRFLVYNPYDYYFPFAIESFKLPSSCACANGGYTYQKH